jgi:hypothetical protein
MADQECGPVRAVTWSELFPWLSLVRCFRLAVGFRVLVLSALAIVLTSLGWWLLGWVFCSASAPPPSGAALWGDLGRTVPEPFGLPGLNQSCDLSVVQGGAGPLVAVWARFSVPFWQFFQGPPLRVSALACFVLSGLWGLAVWAFCGGAITRIVAVQLACEERLSWTAVLRHASRKWLAYFSAPLFPLMGVLLAAVPMCILGFLMRVEFGLFVVAVVWPLLLVGGLLMTLLLLGLAFGWPLMWATISSEGTDSFDALSRSYAYVFERPLHYAFYALVVSVLGSLGWLLVWYFAAAVIGLPYWAAGWGAGASTIQAIGSPADTLGGLGRAGVWFIHLWTGVVKLGAVSFLFSYFWTSATAIYFLLRRDVDSTEMDEVYLEEETQSYGLPPLKTDGAGAPVMGSVSPADEE